MAVLDKKEQKIQAVLGRLPKKYTHEEFVEMFIKLYSKDWGKIKSAYVKQNQDREPGTVVNMPKPELYLKQLLNIYLNKSVETAVREEVKIEEDKIEEVKAEEVVPTAVKKARTVAKPKIVDKEEAAAVKKPTTAAKDKAEQPVVKKTTASAKVKTEKTAEESVVKKPKAPAKAKVEKTDELLVKKPKAAAKKKTEI